jgi:hypothetical protein
MNFIPSSRKSFVVMVEASIGTDEVEGHTFEPESFSTGNFPQFFCP